MYDDIDRYKVFEEWYAKDTADDPDFTSQTAQDWLSMAEVNGFLDDMLALQERGMSMREWISIKFKARNISFPDVRRKGGDHDRGFSPALNKEMRDRYHHLSDEKDYSEDE
jgi:hypothetical protein